MWIYTAWLVVLLGAVIAAYLPSLLAEARGAAARRTAQQFQLAIEVLQLLDAVRATARHGLSAEELAQAMEVESLQLEPVLETLVQLDWIGRLNEIADDHATRYVLLADARSPRWSR